MKPILTAQQTQILRLKAQRLHPSRSAQPASPAQVLGEIFALQAQDLPAALLSMRPRSAGLTAAQIEAARQEDRSIAWTWCLRGTLHLVTAEDARWLVPLLGPALIAGDWRRMIQTGWDETSAARAQALLQAALSDQGPLTRAQIAHLLEAHHLPFKGQATPHLLFRAVLLGILISGPDHGKQHTYTRFETWLGQPTPLPRAEALTRLALRYLQAYAPAAPTDLAYWSGIKRSEARAAWASLADQLLEVQVEHEGQVQTAWLLQSQLPWLDEPPQDTPIVRLLPRFDTFWMGYANRDLLIDPANSPRVANGGIINPTLLVDGRVLGIWKAARRKKVQEVTLQPFVPLSTPVLDQIQIEIDDLSRFLQQPVTWQVSE